MRRIALTAAVAVFAIATLAAAAEAATRWSLRGAGWGHGIGMSQYGAYGFSKRGSDYRSILAHYYRGTSIGNRDGGTVRVLLEPNQSVIAFRTAGSAGGRDLNPAKLYKATRSGSMVVLRTASGRALKRVPGMITVTGAPRVTLMGKQANGVRSGVYRGNIEIRTATGPGLNSINALDLESYVRGVIANESPSSWPAAALEAQAGPYSYSRKSLGAKLGSWVQGRFKGLAVLQRGSSPRVVRAEVRGTGGSTPVTGPQLRARLGLRDTWFHLRRISSATSTGLRARTTSGSRPVTAIQGSVSPSRKRFVTLQRQAEGKWVKVVDVPLERNRYAIHVGEAGVYRIVSGWAAGPTLRVAP
jgi:hypothetical protein